MSTITALARPARGQPNLPRQQVGAPEGVLTARTGRRIVQMDRSPGRDAGRAGQRPATLDPEHPLMGPHPTD